MSQRGLRRRWWTAADCRFSEPRGSFRGWLLAQRDRRDGVGTLAREVYLDRCLGQKRTAPSILGHLARHHVGPAERTTWEAVQGALTVAVMEWGRAQGRKS